MLNVLAMCVLAVLTPTKNWYAPEEPILIRSDAAEPVSIIISDFLGRRVDTDQSVVVQPGASFGLEALYPALRDGTFVVYAVPEGNLNREYVGTPLVVSYRVDDRPGAPEGPMVVQVQPLEYAVIETEAGSMTAALYYDVAPDTVANFVNLARGGYYDNLTFHRIIPGFVLQGGDPRGDGTGNPGYRIEAEFNTRPHVKGVLSMAREGDPMERGGIMPRPEYANSAGSQFFICIDYARTKPLDRKYTAFGIVTEGQDVIDTLATTPIADAGTGRPATPPRIKSVRIRDVTADNDPYVDLIQKATAGASPIQTLTPTTPGE
jgi:peptidyl-prolyl cis-trans isomerase B (cyclophilin B)